MKTTIERKSVTNLKMTIAKDEIRIKIPPEVSQEQVDRIVKFCDYVHSQIPKENINRTLRGKINILHRVEGSRLCIQLSDNNRKYQTREFTEGV